MKVKNQFLGISFLGIFILQMLCLKAIGQVSTKEKAVDTLYNFALSGLKLRKAPKTGEVLATIPFGQKLPIFRYVVNDVIENIDDTWVEVNYNGQNGFVFGGFLTSLTPPKENCKSLENYLDQNFMALSPKKEITYKNEEYTEKDHVRLYYLGRIVAYFRYDEGYESSSENIIFSGIQMKDAYLLARVIFKNDYIKTIENVKNGVKGSTRNVNVSEIPPDYDNSGINGFKLKDKEYEIYFQIEGSCLEYLNIKQLGQYEEVKISRAGGC